VNPTEAMDRCEAESVYDAASAVPAEAREALGLTQARIGGAVAISVRSDQAGFWSKALGFDEPVTADLIEEVCAFFRHAGAERAENYVRSGQAACRYSCRTPSA
jgi:hypothetical protein